MKKIFHFSLLILFIISFVGCNNYGKEINVNGLQLFYTDNITSTEANNLSKCLIDYGFADGSTKSVQIDKQNNIYLFRMVTKDDFNESNKITNAIKLFPNKISTLAFDGKPVEVQLCDKYFKTIQIIGMQKVKAFKEVLLYYTNNVTENEADLLKVYFEENDWTNAELMFDKLNDTYEVKMITKTGIENDQEYVDAFKSIAKEISKTVFNNAQVDFHFCDDNFETLRVAPMQ